MQLTTHFTLEDLTKTSQPYPNIPNDTEIENLTKLAQIGEKLWSNIGPFEVLSAFRSEEVNNAVGGAENSFHRLGEAFDIYPTTMSINDYFVKIYGSDLRNQLGEIALKPDQNALHLSLPSITKIGVPLYEQAGVYTRMTYDQIAQLTGEAIASAGEGITQSLQENPLRTGIAMLALASAAAFFIYRKRQIA